MTVTIVVLDDQENFLQFLDPNLCSVSEEISYGGLRTLTVEYKFQDYAEDKELFRIGNKIWVNRDSNIKDCLYVINTPVELDIYNENQFKFEIEEVLVELNYAPVFSQNELTNNSVFRINNTNNAVEVYVDWNALNYWFGDYFNIGVVQKCISDYASKVSLQGTINRMNLLRQIEEETGNVFVTRYEKDCLDNTIHRYLDFLNPINSSKDWVLTLEYDFLEENTLSPCVDKDGNPCPEEKDWEITPYENTDEPEIIEEEVKTIDQWDDTVEETEKNYEWIPDDETEESYNIKDEKTLININPNACQFQICDEKGQVLNSDGGIYTEDSGETPLSWGCSIAGLTEVSHYTISLCRYRRNLGVAVNNVSYVVDGITESEANVKTYSYIQSLKDEGIISVDSELDVEDVSLPDETYFEIYDYSTHKTLFRTKIDTKIGHVHEEILDFGFNLENINYEIDETSTFTAVAPILKLSSSEGEGKTLNRNDLSTIIDRWKNLSIRKGQVVPMIVEKINVTASSLENAKRSLGSYTANSGSNVSNSLTNYWRRPLKPNDNTDSTDKTFEFYRAKAYWSAPYDKKAKALHVSTPKILNTQYVTIHNRPDTRNEKGLISTPKMGNTESTDEDVFAIYNQVALYLKDHETPEINIDVDVANLRGHEYNNYDLHDKIYLKLPNTGELVTARVTKTTKEAHDIAKNTVELSNYKNINTIKTIQQQTYIQAGNANFTYPKSKNFTVKLVNGDYDETNPDSIHYPVGKLVSFTLYKIENGSSTFAGITHTKLTDAYGNATISMKYDPGIYNMEINFYGDEEFLESSITVEIRVGGTKEVPQNTNKTNKTSTKTSNSKTVANKKVKYKTVKKYWTKCGLSPDKKHRKIVSIARPSSADSYKYKYQQLWKTVFKNYCPNCKRWGGLRFDGGPKNRCITSSSFGHPWKDGVQYEHEITCIYCDSDYCGVTGQEKSYGHISRLKTVEKPKKSSQTEYNKLVKGKLLHSTKKVKVKVRNNVSNKDRKIRAKGLSKTIKNKALSIVKNKTGGAAAKEIAAWMDKHISYSGYPNFVRSPETVLNKGSGNCCDQTRLFLQLCDAAGCCEFFKMYYVHVHEKEGHVYAQLVSKKSGKKRYVDPASDYHAAWGYVCRGYSHGRPASRYPKRPF